VDTLEICKMDRDALVEAWAEIGTGPAPHRMSAVFMRQVLAFEAQAKGNGGLARTFRDRLHKAASVKAKAAPRHALQEGSRIMREWNGVTHCVEVTAHGFFWKGTRYRSLSAIAKAITGAHWSGPRFFNLGADK
jgi:hypothetical protein